MTRREFFEAIINEAVTEEVIAKAKEELEKMDARNAKRATTPSKKAKENEPIKAKIVEFLTEKEEPVISSVIATYMSISTQKASALCRQLVNEGRLAVEDVKIKGKGTQKAYSVM